MYESKNEPVLTNNDLTAQIDRLAEVISDAQQRQRTSNKTRRLMVGVSGIPGSGKSTISQLLAIKLKHAIVLPMDGFHLYRKQLDQHGLKRRGAAFTFDLSKFQDTIRKVKQAQIGSTLRYPSFDHAQKDPVEDSICICEDVQIVIVEGIYVFDKHLGINQPANKFWDIRVWVMADLDLSMERVARRHVASKIEPTYELAILRANGNDRLNAQYIIDNCYNAGEYVLLRQCKTDIKNNSIFIENNQKL